MTPFLLVGRRIQGTKQGADCFCIDRRDCIRCNGIQNLVRNTDGDNMEFSAGGRSVSCQQSGFRCGESQCGIGDHGVAGSRFPIQPRGDVDADDRAAGAVDKIDPTSDRFPCFAPDPGTEETIDHQITVLFQVICGKTVFLYDVRRQFLICKQRIAGKFFCGGSTVKDDPVSAELFEQPGCDNEAVAPVVTAAGEDMKATIHAVGQIKDLISSRCSGRSHQPDPGKKTGPDRFSISQPHFTGCEDFHVWSPKDSISLWNYSTNLAKINKRAKKTEKNRKKCCVNGETGVNCHSFNFSYLGSNNHGSF